MQIRKKIHHKGTKSTKNTKILCPYAVAEASSIAFVPFVSLW